jgi:hypothetical protein
VRALDDIEIEVSPKQNRTANRRCYDSFFSDAKLINHFGNEPVGNAMTTAGAIMRPHTT